MNVRLGAGSLLALFFGAAQAATTFCEPIEESAIRDRLRTSYSEADLVALLDLRFADVLSEGDATLYEAPVISVWKGTVGPKIYIDAMTDSLTFATRDGESGPFELIDPCIVPHADAALLDELFGPSYPPSAEIRESRFTLLEKAMFIAAAGVGLATLVGFVWVLSFVFSPRSK